MFSKWIKLVLLSMAVVLLIITMCSLSIAAGVLLAQQAFLVGMMPHLIVGGMILGCLCFATIMILIGRK